MPLYYHVTLEYKACVIFLDGRTLIYQRDVIVAQAPIELKIMVPIISIIKYKSKRKIDASN